MRVIIPILYNTENTTQKDNLGLKVAREDYDVRNVIFYNIDSVGDSLDDEGFPDGGCSINSGGELYFSPLSKEEVDNLIHPVKGI